LGLFFNAEAFFSGLFVKPDEHAPQARIAPEPVKFTQVKLPHAVLAPVPTIQEAAPALATVQEALSTVQETKNPHVHLTYSAPNNPHLVNVNVLNNQERKEINVFGFNSWNPKDLFAHGKEKVRHYARVALDWIKTHKLRFALYVTAATYLSLQGYL